MIENDYAGNKLRIAIYARCSKDDGSQNPENQVLQLNNYARALGGEVTATYIDLASGSTSDRTQFKAMLEGADRHSFDLLLVSALDRLSREGIPNTLGYLERLKRNGVAVKSLNESWLDTRDEGLGQLLISIFAWVSSQERLRIISRTKAGIERARAEGKHIGRKSGCKDKKPRRRAGYLLRWQKAK